MLKIIAGKFKGRKIHTTSRDFRPSTTKVREAIFSMLDVSGISVMDLFCGSGSLGLEALSRGAKHVTFVDRDYHQIKTLRSNIPIECADLCECVCSNAENIAFKDGRVYDLVIMDPPYSYPSISEVIGRLIARNLVNNQSTICIEACVKNFVIGNNLVVTKYKEYGDTVVAIAQMKTNQT